MSEPAPAEVCPHCGLKTSSAMAWAEHDCKQLQIKSLRSLVRLLSRQLDAIADHLGIELPSA
jgi:hypothetical protein